MTNPKPPRTAKAKRRRHTKEFKQEAVLLARRADVGFARAAKDLGVHESLLRSWSKAQATEGADAFRGHGKKAALEAELARLVRENRTLQMERDILKKSGGLLRQGKPMRYGFIESHRSMWRLPILCRVLSVSKSGYFAWRDGRERPRRSEDRALTVQIKAIHAQSRQTYGSPRIHHALKTQGIALSKKRVARLMKSAGIAVLPARRFVVTTDADHDQPIAPDLLQQDFTATAPNQRWVTDITYVPTAEGWLFLAAIVDLFSRRIVGWAMDATMHRSLVLTALDMAIVGRQPPPGLIHHSDRGSQYASADYRAALEANGMVASMSRPGCCYDNAAAESFWHTLKNELIHRRDFQTRDEASQAIFEYIEVFYNRTRQHTTIGNLSPVQFELQRAKAA